MYKLLIIDDHPPIRQMLQRRFEKLGYQVVTAESAETGKKVLEETVVDLIILDYMMPEVSGFDFFMENKHLLSAPVIMLTAHGSINLAVQFLKNGGADFVEKPIDIDVLNVKIIRALEYKKNLNTAQRARQKAEEDLIEMNRNLLEKTKSLEMANEELDAFAATISHDLKAPLRQIASFIELLQVKDLSCLDDEGKMIMEHIVQASKRMGLLIQSLADFARITKENLDIQLVDLNNYISEFIQSMADKYKEQKINFVITELPAFHADRFLIQQVFANLISNAVKYSSKVKEPTVKIGFSEQPDRHIFSIEDNGIGFNMNQLEYLFQLFKRMQNAKEYEGTGVGLAIVKNIVEKHRGEVWAEGETNKGAAFYFSIPKLGPRNYS